MNYVTRKEFDELVADMVSRFDEYFYGDTIEELTTFCEQLVAKFNKVCTQEEIDDLNYLRDKYLLTEQSIDETTDGRR